MELTSTSLEELIPFKFLLTILPSVIRKSVYFGRVNPEKKRKETTTAYDEMYMPISSEFLLVDSQSFILQSQLYFIESMRSANVRTYEFIRLS